MVLQQALVNVKFIDEAFEPNYRHCLKVRHPSLSLLIWSGFRKALMGPGTSRKPQLLKCLKS